MPTFICEKCGHLDNSANNNNYWLTSMNKYNASIGKKIEKLFKEEYYDTHRCCANCCKGIHYYDGSDSSKFSGDDQYKCVTEKTYKEYDENTLKNCMNYEEIKKRDEELEESFKAEDKEWGTMEERTSS